MQEKSVVKKFAMQRAAYAASFSSAKSTSPQQGGLHQIRDAVGELVLDAAAAARPAINSSVGGAKL